MSNRLLALQARDQACVWCGRKTDDYNDWSIEHILPANRGGSRSLANVALACCSCNSARKSHSAADYAIKLARQAGAPSFSLLLVVLSRLAEAGTSKEQEYATKQLHRLEDWLEQYQRWGLV
jgi:hypothetical protein